MVYYLFTTANTKSSRSSDLKIVTYHANSSSSFECPFCYLNTLGTESSLLNHLTHSHPRFAAQLNSKGLNGEPIKIELVIDHLYDASYAAKHQHTLLGYPQVNKISLIRPIRIYRFLDWVVLEDGIRGCRA